MCEHRAQSSPPWSLPCFSRCLQALSSAFVRACKSGKFKQAQWLYSLQPGAVDPSYILTEERGLRMSKGVLLRESALLSLCKRAEPAAVQCMCELPGMDVSMLLGCLLADVCASR